HELRIISQNSNFIRLIWQSHNKRNLNTFGLTNGSVVLISLIIVYSAGSGAGFYVMKGYMDTIPKSLDEAAYLDGCTTWQVFWRIILPICKPM
ncbi:ABC transporter permease subunit, partial [Gardnerella sp. KA00735]|uniref:ABC transporter permease subunit n=1 Tax=Gardnerella sp. KA00735 TaxID=1973156 RepID=UPI001E2880AC